MWSGGAVPLTLLVLRPLQNGVTQKHQKLRRGKRGDGKRRVSRQKERQGLRRNGPQLQETQVNLTCHILTGRAFPGSQLARAVLAP